MVDLKEGEFTVNGAELVLFVDDFSQSFVQAMGEH